MEPVQCRGKEGDLRGPEQYPSHKAVGVWSSFRRSAQDAYESLEVATAVEEAPSYSWPSRSPDRNHPVLLNYSGVTLVSFGQESIARLQ